MNEHGFRSGSCKSLTSAEAALLGWDGMRVMAEPTWALGLKSEGERVFLLWGDASGWYGEEPVTPEVAEYFRRRESEV